MRGATRISPAELERLLADPATATDPGLADALTRMRAAHTVVGIDVVRRDAGPPLRCTHRPTTGGVVAAIAHETEVEIAWWEHPDWPAELARLLEPATTAPQRTTYDFPHEILLGADEADRTHRPDLLDTLLARHPGLDRVALRRLRDCRGRARFTVSHGRRIGVASWVLLADGWCSLTAYVDRRCGGGVAMVRVTPVKPRDLSTVVGELHGRVAGVTR